MSRRFMPAQGPAQTSTQRAAPRFAGADTATIRQTLAPGSYEVRAYFDDSTGDREVRARLTFTVAETASAGSVPDETVPPDEPAGVPPAAGGEAAADGAGAAAKTVEAGVE